MNLQEIIAALELQPMTSPIELSTVTPTGGYSSDLLSCVMAGARQGDLWITLQGHLNVVAVAALLDLSAVLITEGVQPDPAVLQKAEEQSIILLGSPQPSYVVCGRLWELGLRPHE